jgi:hypothetical protein
MAFKVVCRIRNMSIKFDAIKLHLHLESPQPSPSGLAVQQYSLCGEAPAPAFPRSNLMFAVPISFGKSRYDVVGRAAIIRKGVDTD